MNILFYGSKGWIGKQFIQVLIENGINFFESSKRIEDWKAIEEEINEINPTHVVCFIGRTSGYVGEKFYPTIDYLEQDGKLKENVNDNLFCPLVLAVLCQKKNIHLTYLGTGCIFEFDKDHSLEKGFTEDSIPNFFGSSYSIVKGYTDRIMHLFEDSVLNVRMRMPINNLNDGKNFISKITKYEKICSYPNSMTVLPELLPYLLKMMQMNIKGTINLTNPGYITHNDILEMYKEIIDPNFNWRNFTVEEQNKILDSKRSNNFLDTKRLEELFPNVKNIKDAVRQCIINYKK